LKIKDKIVTHTINNIERLIYHENYHEALAILENISNVQNDNTLLNLMVKCYIGLGDLKRAYYYCQLALSISPDSVSSHILLSYVFLNSGDDKKAFIESKTAYELDDSSSYALFTYGNRLISLGQNEEAKIILTKAIAIDRQNTNALFDLSDLYQSQNQWIQSTLCFWKLFLIKPRFLGFLILILRLQGIIYKPIIMRIINILLNIFFFFMWVLTLNYWWLSYFLFESVMILVAFYSQKKKVFY
jgi:tetratricopeptide (TPR) repeat protein